MTPLAKAVRRVVRDREGTELVVELLPHGVSIRAKGQRVQYPVVGYGALLLMAARMHVANEKADKRVAKAREGK